MNDDYQKNWRINILLVKTLLWKTPSCFQEDETKRKIARETQILLKSDFSSGLLTVDRGTSMLF